MAQKPLDSSADTFVGMDCMINSHVASAGIHELCAKTSGHQSARLPLVESLDIRSRRSIRADDGEGRIELAVRGTKTPPVDEPGRASCQESVKSHHE